MTNEEFVKQFGEEYLALLEKAKDFNLSVNKQQFAKLYYLIDFFQNYIKENGGTINAIDLNPREIHGGLTATFVVLDITGEDIHNFTKALADCSAITFDATADGSVCISVTIPDVFEIQE